MKTPRLLVIFFIISFFTIGAANASEHHSGHGGGSGSGGGGGGSAGTCGKPQLGKFLPPHLATIAPEGEFSFLVFNNIMSTFWRKNFRVFKNRQIVNRGYFWAF